MKIRNKANGGEAEVSEDYGKALIAGGGWEADAPKRQRARKSTPKPAPEPEAPAETPTEVPTTEE
ncbi:head-tail connector protein [Mycobacterium phage Miramae]|uniref:Head-to-tail connector protein n=1 Tax=Mycobacterium phage Miramae TaxID=2517961 RepID=A0A482JFB9_9CAUD|nr:head-tail connector protein [Mycobacterium phage Miramae]QBP31404.1 hypothetical protein SEA_MIRAMAE_16 [Mycobacterium phage Miramae]